MVTLAPTLAPKIGGGLARSVSPPLAFPWAPDFRVFQVDQRSFSVDLDPATLAPATTATFYVDTAGPAGNGLSWATAESAIWAGLNDVGVGVGATIYIMGSADRDNPTVYPWAKAWRSGTSADLRVIVVSDQAGTPGYAISSTALVAGDGELGAWAITLDPSGPNVYEATVATAPDRVIDATVLDTDGFPTKLTLRASVAAVEANPGSYYHAAGSLYVRTWDSRAPSFPTLRPLRGGTSVHGLINGNRTVHIERLGFEGGSNRAFYVQDGNLSMVDADVTHGQTNGCEYNSLVGVNNTTRSVYLFRCRFVANGGDGAGYTAAGANLVVRFLEVDCLYARNTGAGTDQGGSAHHDATPGGQVIVGIRVNPLTSANKSHGFADVGENSEGCWLWILGGTIAGEAEGYHCGNGTKTWMQGTVLAGNTLDLQVDDAAGTIYTADVTYDQGKVAGPGTVTVYTP